MKGYQFPWSFKI